MSAGVYRAACSGCKKVLKIELSDIPEDDFSIDCPRCKTKVVVRASAVKAASGRPAVGAKPTETEGEWIPSEPSVPSSTARSAVVPEEPRRPPSKAAVAPSGFGTNDMTNAILEMNAERKAVAAAAAAVAAAMNEPAANPPPVPEESSPNLDLNLDAKAPPRNTSGGIPRAVPSNAPRTTPRPPPAAPVRMPGWVMPLGGGALSLAALVGLTWVLVSHRGGRASDGGGTPSTVESDASVKADLAELRKKYPQPGNAADLLAKGVALLEEDSGEAHRQAAEAMRQAAAAGDPRALAGAAMATSLLPRSERGGLSVTQANQWADYVQRTTPDAAIGSLSRAMLLASLGRDSDALSTAEAAKAAHPDDPLAWFVAGRVRAKADPAKGAEELRHALGLKPDFALARTELAAAELAAGRLRAAQLVLDARAQAGAPSGEAERLQGELASRIGDDPAARKHFEAAIAAEPKDVGSRLALAWHLVRVGDAAAAAEQARHVIDVDRKADDATETEAAEARVALASALRREGKPAEAATAARASVGEPSTRAVAQYQLGLALMAGGHFEEAVDALHDAAQKAPERAVIPAALGIALWKGGHTEESIASFSTALATDPDLAIAHVGLALDFADADLSGKVLEELGHLVDDTHPVSLWQRRDDPRFPPPPIDLAAFTSRLKAIEQADPNRDPRYRLWQGAVECIAGDLKNGIPRMNIPGLEPSGAAFVAGWELAAGRAADAARLTAKAETARELATRGWAMRAAKMKGDENVFAAALAVNENDPWAALGRAQTLIAKGRKRDAKDLLDRAASRLSREPVYARTAMAIEDAR